MEYCESVPKVCVLCIWSHIAATDRHQSLGVCDGAAAFVEVERLIGICCAYVMAISFRIRLLIIVFVRSTQWYRCTNRSYLDFYQSQGSFEDGYDWSLVDASWHLVLQSLVPGRMDTSPSACLPRGQAAPLLVIFIITITLSFVSSIASSRSL